MEILDYHTVLNISKEITLKAMDKDLIPINKDDMSETAQNIARFYNEVSNALSNLSD